jgi:hypothetical protein
VLVEKGNLRDADALASYAESHSWEDDIVTEVMWRVARAQIQAETGEAAGGEQLGREAVDLAAPTDFLELQATALLALARVLQKASSPDAATVARQARAVYERKGNVVGAGWAAQLVETAPRSE